MSALTDQIYARQLGPKPPRKFIAEAVMPRHEVGEASTVYGCVDARVTPKLLLGEDGSLLVPEGSSLVRNIAARIVGPNAPDGAEEAELLEQEIVKRKSKRISVMGHTSCGGIYGCFCGNTGPHLTAYLGSLDKVREKAISAGGEEADILRQMEIGSVLDSVKNLKTHDVVKWALAKDKLKIFPYLVNTSTKETINLDRGMTFKVEGQVMPHNPEMLIICSKDSHLLPQDDLHIPDGKAHIFRTSDGIVRGEENASQSEAAIIEFALKMGVRDIVVLNKDKRNEPATVRAGRQNDICSSVEALKTYLAVKKALSGGDLEVHGWLLDEHQRLHRLDSIGLFTRQYLDGKSQGEEPAVGF